MLPKGFEWRPFVDGDPALYVDGHQVAVSCALARERYRVDFTLRQHSKFFDSLGQAQAYCAAWARRWEGRIRREVGRHTVHGW